MALRPRESPTSMTSRCTAQALADVGETAVGSAEATPKSVVTPMAGFAATASAPTPVGQSRTATGAAASLSGSASQEGAGMAKSAPKPVVTAMAGFAPDCTESASVAVAGGGSAAGD